MKRERNKLYVISICVALALATIIAYEPVRHNDFVDYDDDSYVTENPNVNKEITRESILWAFTTHHASNWHPLTWLSHMLDCQLFGLNPAGHHIVNLFFHIANTLLLFWILKRMTGAIWRSAFVATAFALHPLHVESVAWVAERKDVLSGLFWMLTMIAYVRYAERPNFKRYALMLLAFVMGLMSKPMLVTLPFVLLLLDYWPLGRIRLSQPKKDKAFSKSKPPEGGYQSAPAWRLIREKIPLFVLAAVSSIITFVVQQSAGVVGSSEIIPLNFRISNASLSYISYIGKMFYPSRLAVLYPLEHLQQWHLIVSFFILVLISKGVIYADRRYLTVGWLWYLGTLVPVIGLIQVGLQAMADRYTYLPSIGIFIMVGWGAAEFFAKWRYRRIVLGITASIMLAVLLICTRIQVRYWQNSLTLFGHAIAVTEKNFIMYNKYGKVLAEKGQPEEAITYLNEALACSPEAHFGPKQATAYNNLGSVYFTMGKYEQAIQNYKEALRLKPDYPAAISNLRTALKKQAEIDEALRKKKEL